MAATVVAVTSDPDKAACLEFGFDHVLPKPLTAHSCYKVLRRWLEYRAQRMFTAPSAADHPDCGGDGGDHSFNSDSFGSGFGGSFGQSGGLYPGGSSGGGGASGGASGDGERDRCSFGTSPPPPRCDSASGATTCTCGGGDGGGGDGGGSGSSTSVGGSRGVSGSDGREHAAPGGSSGAESGAGTMCAAMSDVVDGLSSGRSGDAGSVPMWPTHG